MCKQNEDEVHLHLLKTKVYVREDNVTPHQGWIREDDLSAQKWQEG